MTRRPQPQNLSSLEPAPIRLSVGEALREARLASGLTLHEAAQVSGTNPSHLSRIEGGYVNFTIDTLFALARAVGLELHVTLVEPPIRRLPKRRRLASKRAASL